MSYVYFRRSFRQDTWRPSSALPDGVAFIGQQFPPYRMGLGLRSAALPDSAAAVEIGESWRR